MGWTVGVLGFNSWWGLGIFFITMSRTALEPTQPPIRWVPGSLSLEVKQLGHEADHLPPYTAKVKECVELYLHSPNTSSWCGAQLSTATTFTFTLQRKLKSLLLKKQILRAKIIINNQMLEQVITFQLFGLQHIS